MVYGWFSSNDPSLRVFLRQRTADVGRGNDQQDDQDDLQEP